MTVKFKANSKQWLTSNYNPLQLEEKVRAFWEKHSIAEKLEKLRLKTNKGLLGYVEGPPTLNGYPHVGHIRGRIIKDLHYRWKSMQGYYIPFWTGWDCQGLPVELEVERQLNVKNKKDMLERIGEERFVAECKKAIMKYYNAWHRADVKAGVFINDSKAYWTYQDDYIEREWKYLKHAWDQGLLGEGRYVVAYCPHCQTSLSNAEVGMGYEEVEDPSLYFKFKVTKSENEYFLIWTTMPFTLITDLMLAVHPNAEYSKVQVGDEIWLLAKQRVKPTMKELGITNYKIVETALGKSLEGLKYEYPFLSAIPKQKELDNHPLVHTVVAEEFVDIATATGVVHLAPGNGEEDFSVAQERGVPVYAPFDDAINFDADSGMFAGLFARDADKVVVEELKNKNLLVSVKRIKHEYPTCWRSHHKLIWFARREYYLWTNKITDRIVKAAEKVNYYYKPPKNRFLAFLREGKPWCFSRERVWGTPLPIWKCTQCEHKTIVSSKEELLQRAIDRPKNHFELHKPWIDQVLLKCEKCGGKMFREPFVLDTWHNSGAAPYARFSDNEFKTFVPVDFLVEAIDQTRGWANTLLLEHVILTEKAEAPYKAFLFYGHALDEKGRKLSKSLGNFIDANQVLDKHSADLLRFYLMRKCSPIDSMNFNARELKKRPYQVLGTLYHLFRFFMQNAEYDQFNPRKHTLSWAKSKKALTLPDRWLLSKLQNVINEATEKFESCEYNFALSKLEDFVVNSLSRQYVPMVRHELWSDDEHTRDRRLTIYASLWQTLKTVNLLLNPANPFLSEAMHQLVVRELDEDAKESVNFEEWPTPDKNLLDPITEQSFDLLLKYVSLSHSARQKADLKRRWPLQKATVVGPENAQKAIKKLEDIFIELANVKNVEYISNLSKANSETLSRSSLASEGDSHILLETNRDKMLIGEGLMRDLARRVQSLRKDLGFSPTDVLNIVYLSGLDSKSVNFLRPHLKTMAELVRSKEVSIQEVSSEVNAEWHDYKLDNNKVSIAIL